LFCIFQAWQQKGLYIRNIGTPWHSYIIKVHRINMVTYCLLKNSSSLVSLRPGLAGRRSWREPSSVDSIPRQICHLWFSSKAQRNWSCKRRLTLQPFYSYTCRSSRPLQTWVRLCLEHWWSLFSHPPTCVSKKVCRFTVTILYSCWIYAIAGNNYKSNIFF